MVVNAPSLVKCPTVRRSRRKSYVNTCVVEEELVVKREQWEVEVVKREQWEVEVVKREQCEVEMVVEEEEEEEEEEGGKVGKEEEGTLKSHTHPTPSPASFTWQSSPEECTKWGCLQSITSDVTALWCSANCSIISRDRSAHTRTLPSDAPDTR
jgi:hypothetical protein